MMEVTLTCPECGSGIHVLPTKEAKLAKCEVCNHEEPVNFDDDHIKGELVHCPSCHRKDFYSQKDFNRKLGVMLFALAAILSIWIFLSPYAPYAVAPFLVLYLFDFILFKILKPVAICYKCDTIFRKVSNIDKIRGFDHEMNDRIKYADHEFDGKPIDEKDSIIE